ncbi:uncharacterized protein LOC144331357 [Macaca mulatta]
MPFPPTPPSFKLPRPSRSPAFSLQPRRNGALSEPSRVAGGVPSWVTGREAEASLFCRVQARPSPWPLPPRHQDPRLPGPGCSPTSWALRLPAPRMRVGRPQGRCAELAEPPRVGALSPGCAARAPGLGET